MTTCEKLRAQHAAPLPGTFSLALLVALKAVAKGATR
jgi:hypothetical protein